MLRKLVRKAARLLGYELVPTGAEQNLAFEVALRRLFADRNIDLVLDVGANRGQYVQFLRRAIGYRGDIISFEPSPADFAIAERQAATDPRWIVHPWALGDEQSNLLLNVAESSDFSSFLQPSSDRIDFAGNRVAEQVLVPVKVLDTILPEIGINAADRRIFLKSDTQGYDLQVFRGARRTLDHVAGLQTEISAIPIYDEMPDFLDALAEMRSHGFEVAIMSPVSMDDGIAIEFDCVMLKRVRSA